ncbi:MAG TPA: sugar phosphate isomerase/epimerase family protein [Pyrinomonadaceae bacterium]|jgi:sugar phosphate isomerase/epimerase
MKLAFSTLGCPDWELARIADAALAFGYEAIELRALGGGLDLLARAEFQPARVGATRRFLEERGLTVCCVDTSCRFDFLDENELPAQIALAVRHAQLAAELGAPLVRVFPDTIPEGATRDETRDQIANALREVARQLPAGVAVALETHGDFASGAAAAEIVRRAGDPKISLIWDIANSVAAGEPIAVSAAAVAPYLAHIHLRDARHVEGEKHWLPVLAGAGAVSFAEAVEALRKLDYKGFISFEWEKYWHPELAEPEIAFADFAAAMRGVLSRAAGSQK